VQGPAAPGLLHANAMVSVIVVGNVFGGLWKVRSAPVKVSTISMSVLNDDYRVVLNPLILMKPLPYKPLLILQMMNMVLFPSI
jgi:hypothetical protein